MILAATQLPPDLNPTFFNIVDVEPNIDDFARRNVLRNVALEKFLEFDWHIDGPLGAQFVVPCDNLALFPLFGVFPDPIRHGFVVSAGGDEITKGIDADFGKTKEHVVQRAVEMVVA